MITPEPNYRQELRSAAAKMQEVTDRLQAISLTIDGVAIHATASREWSDLEGVPGIQTRIVQGAYVLDVRGQAGAMGRAVQTDDAVLMCVRAGTMYLRHGEESEFTAYGAGSMIELAPREKHDWQIGEAYLGHSVFVPADYQVTNRPPTTTP